MAAPAAARGFQRILAVKLRQLGDVLLCTPALAALRETFPRAEIAVCVNPGAEAMLEGNPHVNRVLAPPARGSSGALKHFGRRLGWAREVRAWRPELAVDFTMSDASALLTRFSGAPVRLGYAVPALRKGFLGRSRCYTRTVPVELQEHVIRRHLRLVSLAGAAVENPKLVMAVSERERALAEKLLPKGRTFFQVHPVSRIHKKNWPAPYLAETVNWIARRGWLPVITGSAEAAEQKWIAELRGLIEGEYLDLSGKMGLKEMGAISERAKCFLGVDTAPMHIAAAAGAPVIALFGPSSENLWAPWCEKKLVLSRDLPCRLPCKNKQACPHIECLRALTPAMARGPIEEFLASLG